MTQILSLCFSEKEVKLHTACGNAEIKETRKFGLILVDFLAKQASKAISHHTRLRGRKLSVDSEDDQVKDKEDDHGCHQHHLPAVDSVT